MSEQIPSDDEMPSGDQAPTDSERPSGGEMSSGNEMPPNGIQDLKRIQTLNAIAFLAGPVSLIFGGMFLSLVSLICAILAFRRSRRIKATEQADGYDLIASLQKQSLIALIINIVTTAINLTTFVISSAILLGLMQTGQLDQFLSSYGIIEPNDKASTGSIWD